MRRITTIGAMLAMLLLVAASATAGVVTMGNDRDPSVYISDDTGGSPSLASLLDNYGVDVYNDQSTADYFTLGASRASEFTIAYSFANSANWESHFGLYNYNDPSQVLVIATNTVAGNDPGTIPTSGPVYYVTYNYGGVAGRVVSVNESFQLVDYIDGWTGSYTFGFVAANVGYQLPGYNTVSYLDDSMNADGGVYALTFQDDTGWWFAFDYNQGVGSQDFNDLVVHAQSIKPVPEPGTMMLLGSGLIGLAGYGRKKFRF